MAYQAMFTETGRITAVPTAIGENPPAEKQSDLFAWQETEAREKAWDEANAAPTIGVCPQCKKPIKHGDWWYYLGKEPHHAACIQEPDPADEQELRRWMERGAELSRQEDAHRRRYPHNV